MKKYRPEPERERRPARPDNEGPIVYGVLPVMELLRSGKRQVVSIKITEGGRESRLAELAGLARERRIPIENVPRRAMDSIVPKGANHQGVVAFVEEVRYFSLDDVLEAAAKPELLVLLDGVEDPRNLGAVIRTAECAGADGVVIPERRAAGMTDTVAKAAAGATEFMKLAKVGNLNRAIEELKEREIWVVGTSGDAEKDYTEWDWTQPTALVLGAEGSGLHRLVAENCDLLVKIPMYGKIESLNVSVAAGVVLFEARRQRELAR
ncbi:MAG: 23S rRNA (guanosine(2251)-2'-O)-methyltransferase RlmB [Acidobacteria bacterium]|nr:23S rRNA (guanosine(2251)-2'-O)-methyltransferase RlmB [Acidobacteriota bacterium]